MSRNIRELKEGFGRSDSSESEEEYGRKEQENRVDLKSILTRENKVLHQRVEGNHKKLFNNAPRNSESAAELKDFSEQLFKMDICLGWKPRLGIKNPFPLVYPDRFSATLRSQKGNIYKGARPVHSYDLHSCFSSEQTYQVGQEDFRKFRDANAKGLIHHVQSVSEQEQDPLAFDSYFECGNCDVVKRMKTGNSCYEIYLKPDTGTKGHAQWFYFSVYATSRQSATFQIRNMSKAQSIFGKGGRPFFSKDNVNWRMIDGESYYFPSAFTPEEDVRPKRYRSLNTLQFSYSFDQGDRVYFSYCPPYTISHLQASLRQFKADKLVNGLIREEIICHSLTGLGVPLIRSSDYDNKKGHNDGKPIIFVIARAHPGESCGSHMMQGFLKSLFSSSEISKSLRECFEFFVVPMMNPDGVLVGNFRTDLIGDDLNRQYVNPSARFHPTIKSVIYLVQLLKSTRKVVFCLDFHGHSTRPGVFTYGPQLSQKDPLHSFAKILPWMVSKKTEMFNFEKCTYKIPKQKMSTARAFFILKKGTKF